MDRPRRDSRQHNGITVRGLPQPTFATKSAKNGSPHRIFSWPPLARRRLIVLPKSDPPCFPAPLCPKGKFTKGTAGAYKMRQGQICPNVDAYGTKSQYSNIARTNEIFPMAAFGWLWSTYCGSHGRGPRFDP